jgi:Poxvirus Late Transcription Factor VLTF3 like
MNENKLKRIENHFNNRQKDVRMTLSSTIDEHVKTLKKNGDIKGLNEFLLKAVPHIKQYCNVQKEYSEEKSEQDDVTGFITIHGSNDKGKIYKRFMEECLDSFEENRKHSDVKSFEKCAYCEHGTKVYIIAEASMVCDSCGVTEHYQDFGLNIYASSLSVNGEMITQLPYKRVNHLREWLSQVQGKENTMIPEEIIIVVMKELKKERIFEEKYITYERIKKYLKKNGLSKYYEHVPIIIKRICNKNVPSIPFEVEQTLVEKFCEIQDCFEKYRPKKRKNFMSYSYTLHKLCELIGRKDLITLFPLLKSRSKLRVQDEIWEKICQDKGWEFIRSV